MSTEHRSGKGLVAVGQVGDYKIEVYELPLPGTVCFEWRALLDEKEVYFPHNVYDTIQDAISASITWGAGEAVDVEDIESLEPMFSELNLMLAGAGGHEEITTLEQAVAVHAGLKESFPDAQAEAQAAMDLMGGIVAEIARVHGPMSQPAANAAKIRDLLMHTLNTTLGVADRDILILDSFIRAFGAK